MTLIYFYFLHCVQNPLFCNVLLQSAMEMVIVEVWLSLYLLKFRGKIKLGLQLLQIGSVIAARSDSYLA